MSRTLLVAVAALALTTTACGSNVPPPPRPTTAPTVIPDPLPTPGPSSTPLPGTPTSPPTVPPPTVAPNVTRDAPSAHRMYHPHGGISYRVVNSRRGPALAAAAGKRWIDIDSQACRDERTGQMVAVAAHWPRPSDEFEVAPAGLNADLRWDRTPCSAVARLRGKSPDTVQAEFMRDLIEVAAAAGLRGVEWEIKPGVGAFLKAAPYRPVLARARELGVAVTVKTLVDYDPKYAWKRLAAAKRAGAETMLLNHQKEPVVITRAREQYVDYVRGPWRRG